MKLSNKVVVVTGAGSGMGRELAIQLVKKGTRIALIDINRKGLEQTAQLCGNTAVSVHVADIAHRTAVEALPAAVIQQHGAVDCVINNAGIIQPFINVNDFDIERATRLMDINYYGTLYMIKSFLPHLLKRPEAHIANVSSMGGFIPFPGQTIYGASKAAVKLLTEGLYAELKDTQVSVTIIFPGAVNTNIMSNSGVKTPEEEAESKRTQGHLALPAAKAAAIIINAIETNQFRVMVGNDARMLDLLYRIAPKWAVNFITKQMSKMKL